MPTQSATDTTGRMVCMAFMAVVGLSMRGRGRGVAVHLVAERGGFIAAPAATGRARFTGGHAGD